MKEEHEVVQKDLKQGKLKREDINSSKIGEIGLDILNRIGNRIVERMKEMGSKISHEVSRDYESIENAARAFEDTLERTFGGLFGGH